MKKLKVLVSAYACEPDKGSEPGVGWNWSKQIARFHEVWVITRSNNMMSIEKELQANPGENLYFIYYDLPKWLTFWKKGERGLYLYYFLWQMGTYFMAKKVHKDKTFDLIHYVTFGNFWLPTFLHFLPIPFIWGPVGGGDRIPFALRSEFSVKAKAKELVRDIMLASLKINPFYFHICKKARLIIARTESTAKHIPSSCRHKVVKVIETGIDAKAMPDKKEMVTQDIVQMVSVGRLIYVKGFDLSLKAFSLAKKSRSNMRLIIIGDGPDGDRLLKMCREENISDDVLFTGRLGRAEVLEYLSRSSIFLFLSFKEGGPWVLFEAMFLGLPIICIDTAGMAEVVTDECGIKIFPTTPKQIVKDVANAIERLRGDEELRKRMGRAARNRVAECYLWDKKGEIISTLYERVLRNEKPSL